MTGPRTVLVTGGAHGLGAALVRHLSDAGDNVAFADVDADAGEELARDTGALFVRTDVGEPADNRAAVARTVEQYGGLDAVCLNAGVAGATTLGADFDPDAYRNAMRINLDGVVYGFNAALPALRARGRGSVLLTSSLAGIAPAVDAYYSAAKHAIVGLSRSFAMVLGRERITVNALCPGLIDTRALAAARHSLATHGLALADPAEVAAAGVEILDGTGTGQVWQIQAGRPAERVEFPTVTLARTAASATGTGAPADGGGGAL